MSETAKFANVVLRGASFLEKSGTLTHGEHGLPRANEVIPQPDCTPDCTPDGVLAEIARFAAPQFGSQKVGGGWNDQRQVPVFGQCAALAPSSRKLVKNHAGMRFTCQPWARSNSLPRSASLASSAMASQSVTGSTSMLFSGSGSSRPIWATCHNRPADPIRIMDPGSVSRRPRSWSQAVT